MTETDPWQCSVCGKPYVVPTLARNCERQHNEQEKRQ